MAFQLVTPPTETGSDISKTSSTGPKKLAENGLKSDFISTAVFYLIYGERAAADSRLGGFQSAAALDFLASAASSAIKVAPENVANKRKGKEEEEFKSFVDSILVCTENNVTPSVIMLSLLYIARYVERLQALSLTSLSSSSSPLENSANPKYTIPANSQIKIWITSLMLADTFLNDSAYATKSWALVSHISIEDCVCLRRVMLETLNYDLGASVDELDEFGAAIHGWVQWKKREEERKKGEKRRVLALERQQQQIFLQQQRQLQLQQQQQQLEYQQSHVLRTPPTLAVYGHHPHQYDNHQQYDNQYDHQYQYHQYQQQLHHHQVYQQQQHPTYYQSQPAIVLPPPHHHSQIMMSSVIHPTLDQQQCLQMQTDLRYPTPPPLFFNPAAASWN